MKLEKKRRGPPHFYHVLSPSSISSTSSLSSSMAILLVLFSLFLAATPIYADTTTTATATASLPYTPQDNYLLDCGAKSLATLPDGRIFKTDPQTANLISSKDDIQISVPSADVPLPIYLSARIFVQESTYVFHMARPGWHWVRLHFYAMNNTQFDLQHSTFSVATDDVVLLHNFNVNNSTSWILKEYLVNVTTERFSLKFSPLKASTAFINAIEFTRLNMGGPLITSQNDTLGRTWVNDKEYLKSKVLAKSVSVSPKVITYPVGESPLIAPNSVYASASQMADARITNPNFNVTWNFNVDPAFGYLLRMHFCDIVSKSLNDLYFNVYINGKTAISGLDLSTLTSGLAVPYYKDIVVNASSMSEQLTVQIGPMNQDTGSVNAILNGLEVLKMSNSVNSLDGEFGVDGTKSVVSSHRNTVAAVGFAMMFGAFVGLGAMVIKWHKRPQDWQKRNSFSSWLLPLHSGDTSFMTSKNSLGSHKSGFYSTNSGLGRERLKMTMDHPWLPSPPLLLQLLLLPPPLITGQFLCPKRARIQLKFRSLMSTRALQCLLNLLDSMEVDRLRAIFNMEKETDNMMAFDMGVLRTNLPQKKRGLSRFYSGKSRSFTCMEEVNCLEDLKKKEHPDAKKRKKYLDRRDTHIPPYPCRRASSSTQCATPCIGV
ncbi:hypothetical protein L1049_015613 [Liquidambar formosana]|uniref:Malectin-like domain-containing protein n=1 Tax=Liquidambar formosana TaxID=63359 RepID=A0AAP0X2M7_LIQFO